MWACRTSSITFPEQPDHIVIVMAAVAVLLGWILAWTGAAVRSPPARSGNSGASQSDQTMADAGNRDLPAAAAVSPPPTHA